MSKKTIITIHWRDTDWVDLIRLPNTFTPLRKRQVTHDIITLKGAEQKVVAMVYPISPTTWYLEYRTAQNPKLDNSVTVVHMDTLKVDEITDKYGLVLNAGVVSVVH